MPVGERRLAPEMYVPHSTAVSAFTFNIIRLLPHANSHVSTTPYGTVPLISSPRTHEHDETETGYYAAFLSGLQGWGSYIWKVTHYNTGHECSTKAFQLSWPLGKLKYET